MSPEIELAPNTEEILPALSYEQYEALAFDRVSGPLHFTLRGLVSAYCNIRMGRTVIDKSPSFVEHEDEYKLGGFVLATAHRDDIDTVKLPIHFEKVGFHHSHPIAKNDIYDKDFVKYPKVNRAVNWAMPKLGAVKFKRGSKDLSGINRHQSIILDPHQTARKEHIEGQRGFKKLKSRVSKILFGIKPGNMTNYNEMKRVTDDVHKIRRVGSGVVHAAGEFDSPIIFVGVAGLSKVKNSMEYEDTKKRKTIFKDRRSWLGIGPKQVVSFGGPIRLGLLPNLEGYRAGSLTEAELSEFKEEVDRRSEIIYDGMQEAQDRAYAIRGSSLEVDLYKRRPTMLEIGKLLVANTALNIVDNLLRKR